MICKRVFLWGLFLFSLSFILAASSEMVVNFDNTPTADVASSTSASQSVDEDSCFLCFVLIAVVLVVAIYFVFKPKRVVKKRAKKGKVLPKKKKVSRKKKSSKK